MLLCNVDSILPVCWTGEHAPKTYKTNTYTIYTFILYKITLQHSKCEEFYGFGSFKAFPGSQHGPEACPSE